MTTKPWLEAYGDLWKRIKEASPEYDQMAAANARLLGARLMYGAFYHDAQEIAQCLQDYRIRSDRDPFNYTMEYYYKITAMVADAVDVRSREMIQNNLYEFNPQEVPPAAVPSAEAPVDVVAGASAGGTSAAAAQDSSRYDEDSSSDDEDTEGGVALRPDTRKWTFRR